ncbi:hypothetical protein RUM43_004814 [Polyplax serrata]|uniref:Uncharacterized protein n=1 Tax=Polyplax serrata TaxID=468196 RepID=A0AAN8SCK7_POLSC
MNTTLHCLGVTHTPDVYYPISRSPEVVYTWSELDDDELRDVGIQWALGLDIYNILPILEQLASAQTPLIVRTTFTESHSWCKMVGQFANEYRPWPLNYEHGQLSMDIRSYQLLLANASNKVYKGFIRQIEWNGKDTKSFITSQNPLQMNVLTTFRANSIFISSPRSIKNGAVFFWRATIYI